MIMAAPRWRKVGRDLTYNKVRTLLVALSIAVGVFVIGMIAGARDIIVQSLQANAARMNPPSATLTLDSFGEGVAEFLDGCCSGLVMRVGANGFGAHGGVGCGAAYE